LFFNHIYVHFVLEYFFWIQRSNEFKDPMNWSCNFWDCKMDSFYLCNNQDTNALDQKGDDTNSFVFFLSFFLFDWLYSMHPTPQRTIYLKRFVQSLNVTHYTMNKMQVSSCFHFWACPTRIQWFDMSLANHKNLCVVNPFTWCIDILQCEDCPHLKAFYFERYLYLCIFEVLG
jgi:hypothetical protein